MSSIVERTTLRVALGTALAAILGACTQPQQQQMVRDVVVPDVDRVTAQAYPTVNELWSGAQGIYRGCGPNGNVCHNSRQYPNMNSLGAFVWNINRPCNQLQDDPSHIDDWCERTGDNVVIGGATTQLAYIARTMEATDTTGARWQLVVQGNAPMLDGHTGIDIVRNNAQGHTVTLISFDGGQLTNDPSNPSAVLIQLAVDDADRERTLEAAGVVGNPGAIQFGDANRNGVFGANTGTHALILAGHPESSYIIKRLTNPMAGPLMPLANCCFWTKTSLRALWCWINGLNADGSNAMDPIDYGNCPPGPTENVIYPDPGPTCESAGVCPVHAAGDIPSDPTWQNIYDNILTNRCAGGGCHFDGAAGGLDLHSSQSGYDSLVNSTPPRVIPGNPASSRMYLRLTQVCAPGMTCLRMPLGRPALPDNELTIIRNWIMSGAPMNGGDAGATDAGVDAAPEAGMDATLPEVGTDAGSDVGSDTGAVDSGAMDAAAESGADAAAETGG